MAKGKRIKEKRELLNISQTELAKCVGTSKQTLYKYENDIITNIPSDVIENIATHLECSPAYIMGWEDDPDEPRPLSPRTEALARRIDRLTPSDQDIIESMVDRMAKERTSDNETLTKKDVLNDAV